MDKKGLGFRVELQIKDDESQVGGPRLGDPHRDI